MAPVPTLDPRRHALFLDFDGTLAEFRDDPAAVSVERRELDVLRRLHQALSGALAIVSGRRIDDLDRILAPLAFAAAGVHGLEQREAPGGEVRRLAGPAALDDLRERLSRSLPAAPGVEMEDKGTALVLHFRKAPLQGDAARRMMDEAVAGRPEFAVMHGSGIVEAHVAGMDKGRAVRILCAVAPFAGRIPVYVGDDTTDEFALRAVREAGGVSIKVGPGETAAAHRLSGVPAVHRWLAQAADRSPAEAGRGEPA